MATTKRTKQELDEHHDTVEREYEVWRKKRDHAISQIEDILAATPAVQGFGPSFAGKQGEPRMAIKSGELSDKAAGPIRVTFFGPDGPHGHVTKRTDREAAEAVLESMSGPFTAMADADVMEWTTTPTFERGSRIIAIVQAENTLRYLAGRLGRYDWAADVVRQRGGLQFDEVPLERLDDELARIVAAIRALPVQNTGGYGTRLYPRPAFVANPAWVTGALADHYELIDDKVPARWLPQLHDVSAKHDKLVAEFTEFGCGAYGCVLATHDPETVLKVTSDETESEFAATLANDLVAPICVEYRMVIRINARHQGAPIHLLWREAADHVGQIESTLGAADEAKGHTAARLIERQHLAAGWAYAAMMEHSPARTIAARIKDWLASVRAWLQETTVPELHPLATGILAVWDRQHVLFGDIHAGNVGYVASRDAWVITDPGNIAVVSDDRYW